MRMVGQFLVILVLVQSQNLGMSRVTEVHTNHDLGFLLAPALLLPLCCLLHYKHRRGGQ